VLAQEFCFEVIRYEFHKTYARINRELRPTGYNPVVLIDRKVPSVERLDYSIVQPPVVQLMFQCMKCGTEITQVFCDGKFSPPMSCDISGCKSQTFTPKRPTAKLIDFLKIRMQEFDGADNHEEGRVPRTEECDLRKDLVDGCIPGHVVVGDLGLGKSQLLQAAAAVSPQGIYVGENTTLRAGLTIVMDKDPMTNEVAIEAGTMVLADRVLSCVDGFDTISAQHQSLLEAMEQQCASVLKADLVACLSPRASMLAAANPVSANVTRLKIQSGIAEDVSLADDVPTYEERWGCIAAWGQAAF
jgi:DNA replicative helicase MCM subunit Mcm2 (Cdc46/Mcm family)